MNDRDLNHLHPDLLPLANEFLSKCKDAGLDIIVTCTYRSPEDQAEAYAIGRTTFLDRKVVTYAKPGESDHNFMIDGNPASKAFDIVPIVDGEAMWNENHSVWDIIARIWRNGISNDKFWLDWYGRIGAPFHECAHFCLKQKF